MQKALRNHLAALLHSIRDLATLSEFEMIRDSLSHAIAVVGMACRVPGADNLQEFWNLVRSGGCAVGPLPPQRLNRELYFDPQRGQVCKTYSDLGGIVSTRPYDPTKCPLPDEVIEQVDVAHLTLCEVAAEAVRQGGYDPFDMPHRNVGVFIGHTGGSPLVSHYLYSTMVAEGARALRGSRTLLEQGWSVDEIEQAVIGETRRKHPSRRRGQKLRLGALTGSELISEAFGLHGPYMVVDAACASSLQAMAIGIRALLAGRLDAALVGGASYCKSDSLVLFSSAQSVSPNGTRPFSRHADGLVASEGYVVFLLKTLERAIGDGDRIQAVISGLGVSSDGRGKSLWAPRAEGQVLAVRRAYGESLDAARVQYIEAHATSTQVGDATELAALSTAFRPIVAQSGAKIPIGSVKGNIGHTLETAGVAGLIKTILAMQKGKIPPAVQCGELTTEVDWETCPFVVPFQESSWPEFADGHPRRAAVNSFGIGGLNVHVVVDEYQPQASGRRTVSTGPQPAAKSTPPSLGAECEPIAVIGIGCVFPGAFTVGALWDLLSQGQDPKIAAPEDRIPPWCVASGEPKTWATYNNRGGFIENWKYDWRRHKVPPKQIAQANPLQFMLLDAADQAFADAGLNPSGLKGDYAAVVVGTMFGSDFSDQLQMGLRLPEFRETLRNVLQQRGLGAAQIEQIEVEFQEELLRRMPALLDETGSFTSSTLASRITKSFNLMGGALALDAGECSGALALQAGVDMLRQGHSELVICAAGQRSMDLWLYEGLSLSGILAKDNSRSGLAANRKGTLPGEGCGVLILKRLRDAQRDGNPIRGVIRGIGVWSDENHREAVQHASAAALRDANLQSSAIMAVETACTPHPKSSQSELVGLIEAYADSDRPHPVRFGDLSNQIGALGGAMAMAELIKSTLATSAGVLPPTIALDAPSPEMRDRTGAVAANQLLPIPTVPGSDYRASVVSSVSGRMVYQIVLDNGAPVPPSARRPNDQREEPGPVITNRPTAPRDEPAANFRLARFYAANQQQLIEELAAEKVGESAFAAERADLLAKHPARCVILAADLDELRKKARLAADFIEKNRIDSAADQGIFFRTVVTPLRVAFLFPGQGSQYLGMLQPLCTDSLRAHEAKARANAIMTQHGFPTFEELAWNSSDQLGTDVWYTQVSMLLADWLTWEAAGEAGWRADLVGGHSFGEFPALVAAGAWSLEEAILATRDRCDAVSRCGQTPTRMMSLTTSRSVVEDLLRASGEAVYFCAENGPEQSVVGGAELAVAAFAEVCQQHRIRVKTLPVPFAFHTPLLRPSRLPLARALEKRTIVAPAIPIVTSTFHRTLETPSAIRDALVAQMTGPVEFVRTVQKLRELGATHFLEIGPSQVLGQLARRILANDPNVVIVSMDATNKAHGTTYLRLRATREAWGQDDTQSLPIATAATHPQTVFVDATQRRRARLRAAASQGQALAREQTEKHASHTSLPASLPGSLPSSSLTKAKTNGQSVSSQPQPATSKPSPTVAAGPAQPTSSTPPVRDTRLASKSELELFLIRFVVEQTGYPQEIVELDADLEADLGIDSIKKAQLFGELGNQFQLAANPNLSLDDFATLRSVLEYLNQEGIGGSDPGVAAKSASAALSTSPTLSSPPAVNRPQPAPAAPLQSQPSDTAGALSTAELEAFLVNFVVEQTGYPAEIVELDADLEADLGIDSIKKAQLFGELGNQFQLEPDANVSLDDFSTLLSVLSYLHEKGVGRVEAAGVTASRTSMPSESSAQGSVAEPTLARSASVVTAARTSEDLESFLINFVVEQTGYPAEIVELDADLEADLGIDSIKKAQLFGELGNQFQLQADPNLSLDDFATLRSVLRYLHEQGIGRPLADFSPVSPPVQSAATAAGAAAKPAPALSMSSGTTSLLATPALPKGALATVPLAASSPVALSSTSVTVAMPDRKNVSPGVDDLGAEGLISLLVNFVVEQTGYPAEIVELDADLEADLGIDSIKKAQLFGEIGNQFQLVADPDLNLDDFRTLRSVLTYLQSQGIGRTVSALESERGNVPRSDDRTVVRSAASLTEASLVQPTGLANALGEQDFDLDTMLVNFVVEQTGYPVDLIDFDADLEADLGIDSIKKAQLFGELGARFQLEASPELSLDDFPTLREIRGYLLQKLSFQTGVEEPRSGARAVSDRHPSVAAQGGVADAVPAVDTKERSEHSTHFERGFVHGRHHLQAIRAELRARAAHQDQNGLADDFAWYEGLSSCERDELAGMAAGAEVVLENLLALNTSLGTSHSPLAATLSLLASSETAGLAVSSWLAAESPFCLEVDPTARQPVLLRIPGQLGGVAGWNQAGLAVAICESAVKPKPGAARKCPPAAALVARILREATTLDEAARIAGQTPISAGVTLQVMQLKEGLLLEINDDQQSRVRPAVSLPASSLTQLQKQLEAASTPRTVAFEPVGIGQLPTRQAASWIVLPREAWLRLQDNASRRNGQAAWTRTKLPVSLPHFEKPLLRPLLTNPSQPIPFPDGPRITQRFLPRPVHARAVAPGTSSEIGSAIVYGDAPESPQIAALLVKRGVRVTRISEQLDDAALDAEWTKALNEFPNASLFLTLQQPPAMPSERLAWEDALQRKLLRPFQLCQHWITRRAGVVEGAMLVAVTRLGGRFGLPTPSDSALSGGLAGLCKGIRNEHPGLRVKVIDVSSEITPSIRAEQIVTEAFEGDSETEVGYPTDGRIVIRYACPELPAACGATPTRGSQWVITGGARGVTGVVAMELGQRYGIELHLLGTTPLDQIDPAWERLTAEQLKALRGQTLVAAKRAGEDPLQAWSRIEKALEIRRQLRALQDAGVTATYHLCDLSDWDALQAVLDHVRHRGPIEGIVHGAGFESAARFEKKKLPLVKRTLSAKAGGAAALLALTQDDPLGWFIGFGSTSGRLGGVGQADYSMANDLLAKQVGWLRATRPTCRATVFHWHAWDEIGMAARPESRFVLEGFGLKFMPPKEGVAYLLTELEAGLPESEVMITEELLCPTSLRLPPSDPISAQRVPPPSHVVVTPIAKVTTPLLESIESGTRDWMAGGILYPDQDPFLLEHRMFDRPVLPGVTGWEALAQAVTQCGETGRYVRLSQVEIIAGMRFPTNDPRRFWVHLQSGSDGYQASLVTRSGESSSDVGNPKEHVRGVVLFTDTPPESAAQLSSPPFPFNPMVYPEGAAMYHGPRIRTLNGLMFQHGGGWGKLVAGRMDGLAGTRAKEGWVLPMALLDGVIVGCAVFCWLMCGRRVEVPEGLDTLWLLRQPLADETCQLQFRFLRNTERHSWFDWELFGADGGLIMQCRGLRLVKLGQEETP